MTGDRARGVRAEEVASWYFRINGFMLCEGYVLHPGTPEDEHAQLTEADLYGVRFPYSVESLPKLGAAGFVDMADDGDRDGLDLFRGENSDRPLFILVEVKAGLTAINGPWSRRAEKNMHKVIRRMGFLPDGDIDVAAECMYDRLRFVSPLGVIQYITVGRSLDRSLNTRYGSLLQISFKHMAGFFYERFSMHPEKCSLNPRYSHEQWPPFARRFAHSVASLREQGQSMTRSKAVDLVHAYIDEG